MPAKPPGLLTIGRQQYFTPAPVVPDEYYRGSMPEYVAPNQDRLATTPEDQMQYWWAKRYGIPQERP